MPLQPIAASSATEQVHRALEAAIVRCELEPGEALSDRRLAADLGVSRTPVREALHLLEASRLVHRRARVGWVVAEFDEDDIRELFELRRLFEPAGLRRLPDWDDDAVRDVAALFDDFPEPITADQIDAYLARDAEFHTSIVIQANNSRLLRFYNVAEKQIDRARHYVSYRYEGRVDDSLREHRAICTAIKKRNPEIAIAALIEHITAAEEKLSALLYGTPEGR